MNRERLEHLITVLERVERENLPFDMDDWAVDPLDCGTAACAAGWAARDPEFQKQGLSLSLAWGPSFAGEVGAEAMAVFLDIAGWDSVRLFIPDEYNLPSDSIRPAHVIACIRVLLAEGEGEAT